MGKNGGGEGPCEVAKLLAAVQVPHTTLHSRKNLVISSRAPTASQSRFLARGLILSWSFTRGSARFPKTPSVLIHRPYRILDCSVAQGAASSLCRAAP